MLAALNRPSGDDDSVFGNKITGEKSEKDEEQVFNHFTDWSNFNVTFYLWMYIRIQDDTNLIEALDPMNATFHVANQLHTYCMPSLFVPVAVNRKTF